MKKLLLFDIDGTLTQPQKVIQANMVKLIREIHETGKYDLGVVGGGLYSSVSKHLGTSKRYFKYVFAESGGVTYIDNIFIDRKDMKEIIKEYCEFEKIIEIIYDASVNFIKKLGLNCPRNIINVRSCFIYVSMIGFSPSSAYRKAFIDKDAKYNYRERLREELLRYLPDFMEVKIGGNIGISIYIKGFNKSQVLEYLDDYDDITFFCDRVKPYGNDYPLYSHPRVKGVHVINYNSTLGYLKDILKDNRLV